MAQQLVDPALDFLTRSRGDLVVEGIDWAPPECEYLYNKVKMRKAAVALARSTAAELRVLGFRTLDQVLNEESGRLRKLSVPSLLVVGRARIIKAEGS